ncbi:TPA: hypothetical protein HA246_00655 [Candidatus Woesearchaeota archaeon]|nr:hypothetical protein [Candidatus Woesearchaeota archaeon]
MAISETATQVAQTTQQSAQAVDPLTMNIIAFSVLGGFAITFALPKIPKHIIHSLFLMFLGGVPILYELAVTDFQLPQLAIMTYIITAIIMLTGGTLVKDGWKEGGKLGYGAMIFGIIIMASVLIPTLYKINAITFNIPAYPPIINAILYILSGVLLLISTFMLGE